MLVADGGMLRHDGAAGRSLQDLPAGQRLRRVRCNAVEVGRVNSRAMGVQMREVGECMNLLPSLHEARAQRCFDGLDQCRNTIPGGSRLYRINGVAHVPKRIAEIGCVETFLMPLLPQHASRGNTFQLPSDTQDLFAGMLHGSLPTCNTHY